MEEETPQSSFQAWLDRCMSDNGDGEVAHELRKEAQHHFQSLQSENNNSKPSSTKSTSTVAQDLTKASSSTSNGAMARLVSTLGPAFSQNNVPLNHKITIRVRAVNCLIGASEGSRSLTYGVRQGVGNFLVELCRAETNAQDSDVEIMDSSNAYIDAGNLTSTELTQQLEDMDRAHQQRNNGGSSIPTEDVRDGAIEGLIALLQSQLDIFPTQQSQSPDKNSSSPISEAIGVVHQSMELRMELSMLGLRYRCENESAAVNHYNNYNAGAGYETISNGLNAEGLSQLPRIRRSLCFKLLEAGLDGLKVDKIKFDQLISQLPQSSGQIDTPLPTSILKSMQKFAKLMSSCLHGETDPRCLLQLLRLLNKMQQIMLPLFSGASNIHNQTIRFPTVEVFDAVAPYYPVHFTPPKNDPHGITREMLQDALMAVLCERGAMYEGHLSKGGSSDEDDAENGSMAILSARMFLERLDPSKYDDYDPPSSQESEKEDKLAALRDLSNLLLPLTAESKDEHTAPRKCATLTTSFVLELSSSLVRAHEEAVSSDRTADIHSLASNVRKFASSFAYNLAPACSDKANDDSKHRDAFLLWEAFVHDANRRLATNLSASPQSMHGRSSTAYLAALAAEGGLPTLRKVLDVSMPRLLDLISNHDNSQSYDDEKMAAAVRGIAAFMSSCYVALQMWGRDNQGVKIYPHPLSKYTSPIIRRVADLLNEMCLGSNMSQLKQAAAGAFESALTAGDISSLEDEDISAIEKVLNLMSDVVLKNDDDAVCSGSTTIDDGSLLKWKKACARALGAAIAIGFGNFEDSRANSCERLASIAQSLLPKFIKSSIECPERASASESDLERYDWIVLAGACANGSSNVSEQIVPLLLTSTIDSLQGRTSAQRCFPIMALSYLISSGGPHVGNAFHGLSSSATSAFDVINELCLPLDQASLKEESTIDAPKQVIRQLPVGMSHLQLPESLAKEEETKNATIQRAYSVLPYLVEAFACPSSALSCDNLVASVDQVLPPLSEQDEVKLYVTFPLLAALLNGQNDVWKVMSSTTTLRLQSMATYLAQFSISADHDCQSRSAAASCLFAILINGDDATESDPGSIRNLLETVCFPAITDAAAKMQQHFDRASTGNTEFDHTCVTNVEAVLDFMALLGSAAACRGGRCSQTADDIASCLIQVACTGSSSVFSFAIPTKQAQRHPISDPASLAFILPAAAFGSMFSVKSGGPFWRQRIIHKTLPTIMKTLLEQATSQNPPALGSLAVVSHLLCCAPRSHLGDSNILQMIPTLIAGLVYYSKNLDALNQCDMAVHALSGLSTVIAALTKLLRVSPEDVTKFIGVIIPSLLLLSTYKSYKAYIPIQLIALQCLEIVTTHQNARNAVLREKDQVTAALSAIVDHPSKIVRQAVVQVRNVFVTLEF